MRTKRDFWTNRLYAILALVLISGIVYLPAIASFTYYRDDWYLMHGASMAGAGIFREIFSADRPARGLLLEIYYSIFGPAPLAYNLAGYFWRLAGAICAFWLFDMLWPRRRRATFSMALLFLLYPGYLRWYNAIDFQAHVVSLCLEVLSFTLTLKAIQAARTASRAVLLAAAVLTGWAYLGLVEYALGMEVFRFLSVYLLTRKAGTPFAFFKKGGRALYAWLVTLLVPFGYLFWRLFLFENARKATDIGAQLGAILDSPVLVSLWWGVRLLQSTINTMVLVWGVPFYQMAFQWRLREILVGLLLATLAVLLYGLVERRIHKAGEGDAQTADAGWQVTAIWVGLVSVLFGVSPVVLANRSIDLSVFSYYGLPALLGTVLFTVACLYTIPDRVVRSVAFSLVLAAAVMTQHSVSVGASREAQIYSNFWWQVTWRAPGLREGTTLLVHYPGVDMGEDSDIVWGPANMIYYPQHATQLPIDLKLGAIRLTHEDIQRLLIGHLDQEIDYRQHLIKNDFGNVLIISQPNENACVHVFDGRWSEVSASEGTNLMLVASSSKIENVLTEGQPPTPQAFVFGPEPPHDWCFYYQKAELARQQGDWDSIARIQKSAEKEGLLPNDQIEWMPFLQANAYLDDRKEVKQLAKLINTQAFYKGQACQVLNQMGGQGYPLSAGMQAFTAELFCSGSE